MVESSEQAINTYPGHQYSIYDCRGNNIPSSYLGSHLQSASMVADMIVSAPLEAHAGWDAAPLWTDAIYAWLPFQLPGAAVIKTSFTRRSRSGREELPWADLAAVSSPAGALIEKLFPCSFPASAKFWAFFGPSMF